MRYQGKKMTKIVVNIYLYKGNKKMWVDCFVKGRQMQPGGGKIVYPMGKWSVEPWQGGRERQDIENK